MSAGAMTVATLVWSQRAAAAPGGVAETITRCRFIGHQQQDP
jgi:hypothetical protein